MRQIEDELAQQGIRYIAGVDEAGRGPLAGPVVSAAVILPFGYESDLIKDSKALTPVKRERLYKMILQDAQAVGVGACDHEEIDQINIHHASLLSMKRAVMDLALPWDFLLIDGKFTLDLSTESARVSSCGQKAVIKGDAKSISIAAASIVAKVTRDHIMEDMDRVYPEYGFARHKGYPTKAHKKALAKFGPCRIHRRTFRGVS